jgi:hypothetical protein
MQMIFEINGKPTTIFSKEKETSFNKIIDNIRVILRRVYIVLSQEDETLQPVFDEYETKIKALLDQLHNDIKDYPSLVNKFKPELDRILDVVYTSTTTAYSNLDRASITSVTAFSNLLQEINVGNNQYVNSIKTSSTNAIDTFLSSNQANLNTLYSSWTNFHKNLLTELNKHKQVLQTNSSFTFDLGLYYNIKDIMSSILSIYQNFESNLKNALNIEKNKFEVYVDNQFDELVDPSLRETEVIAENLRNNVSVIDAMNYKLGKPNGDNLRNIIINEIISLRNTLNTIMNEIFSQISNIYSNKMSSTDFNNMVNDINSKLAQIKADQEEILNNLRLFNKYDINFDIYFDDVRVLNDLEIEANEYKKLSYNTYISGYLNGLSDYFLTEEETIVITNQLSGVFEKLKEYLTGYQFTNAKEEAEKLVDVITNINTKYLGEEFGNRVINYYSNKDFLNTMIDNYYKDLDKAYSKFNTTFYDINYQQHKDKYVTKPKEIMNKLLSISYALNPENSLLHQQIQELIVKKIRLVISTTSYKVYGHILNEVNELIQNLSTNPCCLNGYNLANLEQIKVILRQFQGIYIDEVGRFIPPYLYNPKSIDDEFGIKETIIIKENNIRNNLRRIVDMINIDFINTFCYGNELVCAYPDVVSGIDHYYYQASKLRVSLKFLQSLVTIAQSMIGDNTLSGLSSSDFTLLFETELNYRENEIINDIDDFLSKLNVNTTKYIEGSLESFKSNIESYLLSGVNDKGIAENIETIAKSIFINPDYLLQEIFDYLYYPCGPISKLELAFNEEIEFHKIMSEERFYFNAEAYKSAFKEVNDTLLKIYENEKNELFKDWSVFTSISDSLSEKVKDFVSKSYEYIYEKVNSLSDVTHFEFLNMEYSIKLISQDVLHDVTQSLLNEVNNKAEQIYNNYLETLKTKVKEDLDEKYDELIRTINYEYTATENYYNVHRDNSSDDSLHNAVFQEVTKNQIYNVVHLFFEKAKQVYSNTAINEFLYKAQINALNNNPFIAEYKTELENEVYNDIIKISELSYRRLVEERTIFQANIKIFYETAFRRIFSQFIKNKGKDYLDNSVDFDYSNNIYSDFELMKSSIRDTETFVSALLDTAELKGLGYNLAQRFTQIYPEIREELNSLIPKKVTDIIYPKIERFKDDAETKVVDLFVKTIEEENKKIKK